METYPSRTATDPRRTAPFLYRALFLLRVSRRFARLQTIPGYSRAFGRARVFHNESGADVLDRPGRRKRREGSMGFALWVECQRLKIYSQFQLDWRRGWDSNPRYGFPYTRFPSVRLKPVGHLSGPEKSRGQYSGRVSGYNPRGSRATEVRDITDDPQSLLWQRRRSPRRNTQRFPQPKRHAPQPAARNHSICFSLSR